MDRRLWDTGLSRGRAPGMDACSAVTAPGATPFSCHSPGQHQLTVGHTANAEASTGEEMRPLSNVHAPSMEEGVYRHTASDPAGRCRGTGAHDGAS